jgi:bifunctional UDP-N-acetylglucosamine pyrophosphorylase/glucosamine-1-phosphate N-acetyltransferase
MDDPAEPAPLPAPVSAVVLAAGEGTRMRSALPKVLHGAAGRPLVHHVLAALAGLPEPPRPVAIVVGRGAEAVGEAVAGPGRRIVVQAERRGTGHAVQVAGSAVAGRAVDVLVLYGDVPLVTSATLEALLARHRAAGAAITLLSAQVDDAKRYGRVVRDAAGRVARITEHADATEAERAGREINGGVYVFRDEWLWPALDRLAPAAGGELYLTDLVAQAVAQGELVEAVVAADPAEVEGVNDRADLAQVERVLRQRERARHLAAGVGMVDPATVWIDAGVVIGADTVIWPNSYLLGGTRVGAGCVIGPDTWLADAQLADGVTARWSVLEGALVGQGSDVGPYAHLRPGTVLAEGVHVGNFGEVKNSSLGPGTRMGHFGYLGDATVGAGANIGAGTVTCNFDGHEKHATVIGAGAFVGSDTMLVAPVTLGEGARTGAGSVVTRDVPAGVTVVGVPARPVPGSSTDAAASTGAEAPEEAAEEAPSAVARKPGMAP